MTKKTYDAVDLCKWICAWLVLYIHISPVLTTLPLLDEVIHSSVCRLAVPFFFGTSAFFLFRKMDSEKRIGQKNRRILRKFCANLFTMYLLWILIYNLYAHFYRSYNGLAQKDLRELFQRIFFSGDVLHLWYLMASVYAAPVVYLLWCRGRKALIAGCLICEALCLLDWPYPLIPLYDNAVMSWIFKEMGLIVNAVLNGIPMMCLGALCLTDHKKRSCCQWGISFLCLLPLMLAELFCLRAYYGESLSGSFIGIGFTMLPLIYCLINWLLSSNFKLPVPWLGKAFRLSSTWFYCTHWLMVNLYSWVFAYNGLIRYLMIGCLTTVSGIPYVAFNLLRDRAKAKPAAEPTSFIEEHTYE